MNTTNTDTRADAGTPKHDEFVKASNALTDALVNHGFAAFNTTLPLDLMTPRGVAASVIQLAHGLKSVIEFCVLHTELAVEMLDDTPDPDAREAGVKAAAEQFTSVVKGADRVTDRDMLPYMPIEACVAASLAHSIMLQTLREKVMWVTENGYLNESDWTVVRDAALAHYETGRECFSDKREQDAYQQSPSCLCVDCLLDTAAKRFLRTLDMPEALEDYERAMAGKRMEMAARLN